MDGQTLAIIAGIGCAGANLVGYVVGARAQEREKLARIREEIACHREDFALNRWAMPGLPIEVGSRPPVQAVASARSRAEAEYAAWMADAPPLEDVTLTVDN